MERFEELINKIYVEERNLLVTARIRDVLQNVLGQMLRDEQGFDMESFFRKETTIEFVGNHQPLMTPVSKEVSEHVAQYLASGMPQYSLVEICRHSNHPDDRHIYSVAGLHKDGSYACWTNWNDDRQSLNHGHYRLKDLKTAEEIIKDNFYDFTDEPEKYGYDRTIKYIETEGAKEEQSRDDEEEELRQEREQSEPTEPESNIIEFRQWKRGR